MRAPLLLLGGTVLLSVAVARALSCVCSPLECDVLTEDDCPGGLTWDPCKCCKVCARVEGEPCGGLFGFSGSCADGLQCVIKNLLPHTREVDEGVCTKVPGRWRRHCPRKPVISEPGCNLVGEGPPAYENGSSETPTGKCVCGPSVYWCPDEPAPYTYKNRHECELNLQAKMAYDGFFDEDEEPRYENADARSFECPSDSVPSGDGECKCLDCPPSLCSEGKRVERARPGNGRPGSCCDLYRCVPSESILRPAKEENRVLASSGCVLNGTFHPLGETWKQSSCETCTCDEMAHPICETTMCRSCENPEPPLSGECCQRCPLIPTRACPPLENCEIACELARDEDDCPKCECAANENLLITDGERKICPELSHCDLSCSSFAKDEGGCPVCACETSPSTIVSGMEITTTEDDENVCPELKCDLHCPYGLAVDEKYCTRCECRQDCPPMIGCRKRCPFGYKTGKRGCPICRCNATCTDHTNKTHPEGSSWQLDACTDCTCETGGHLNCKVTICSYACNDPSPPEPGSCCSTCPITVVKNNEKSIHHSTRGWGTIPITLIVVLALLCLLLIVHIVRNRFRARLSPSDAAYPSYPPQYYKCVPVYDTSAQMSEKIVRL